MPSPPSADSDAFVLEGVRHRYTAEATVLEAVDLRGRRGEILGLIGPSGSGKTTLLHLLMGLIEPSAGRVEVSGRAAMVFQKPQLLPWLSVVDNAAFGLECRGVPRDEARSRARERLARVGLHDVADAAPHTLSEGMKQRVNLTRALLVEPDLLLMDEPFAALDVLTRRRLWDELLQQWAEASCTIVIASHALDEVVVLGDRVAVLGGAPTTVRTVEPIALPRPRRLVGDEAVHRRIAALAEHLEG